jgi:signal transduction histidine kinase
VNRPASQSIQIRLTASYTAMLAVTFALIGVGLWVALNHSIDETADRELRARLANIKHYFDSFSPSDLEHLEEEFREESLLSQSSASIRIFDPQGRVLFETPGTDHWPAPDSDRATQTVRAHHHQLIRVLTAPVRVGIVQIGLPIGAFEHVKDDFLWILALGSPLLLLLAWLGGYWMSGRTLKPIDAAFERMTEFTADASHELRTPVAIIQTTAELMQSRPRTNEEHLKAWSTVSAETARTASLIADLLTLARADAGQTDLEFVPLDLAEVVPLALEEMRVMAEVKGIALELGTSLPCPVKGDAEALRRAVCILLDNAIKFTPAAGRVAVSVRPSVVTVTDSGPGISGADMELIFQRFYRVSKDRSRGTGGSGLGLSIAQYLVRQHGGEIRVESTLGKGSSFSMILPALNETK